MMVLRILLSAVVIAGTAVAGLFYRWPLEILVPVLSVLFLAGILVTFSYYNTVKLKNSLWKLKEFGVYFVHRFAGNSSQSIFAIINSLFNIDNAGLQEWVRACNMSQQVFNAWCNGFVIRIENDSKATRYNVYISIYLHELWSLAVHYQEYIEQFCTAAEKIGIQQETVDQYNRFLAEYNPFVQKFREYIGNLKKANKTEIEPPSVELFKELPVKPSPQPEPKKAAEIPKHDENKGYITGRKVP